MSTTDPLHSLDSHELAVMAVMSYLDRYGGLWSGDHGEVRAVVADIIGSAMELADDYPGGDDAATAYLRHVATYGVPPEGR